MDQVLQDIQSDQLTEQSCSGMEHPKRHKRKTLGTYCSAVSCHNSRHNCKLSMFRFPKDENRCRKWVQNTRCDDIRHIPTQKLYSYELCSKHFEDSQFTNKEKKNRLIHNAIPTLFYVPNPPERVTPHQPLKSRTARTTEHITETIEHSEPLQSVDTPRKRKLK